MNSPFIITNSEENRYAVSWPTYEDIRTIDVKIKLLELLFKDLQNYNIGLVLKYNIDEFDVLWIDYLAYAQTPLIDNYMHDHYTIVGVVFDNLDMAKKFQNFLEKKLIWKILNE